MVKKFNSPPNWPTPPVGFVPPPGWQPDPTWGPAPEGWKLWVDDRSWFARHKVLTAVGALTVVIIAASALGGGDEPSTVTVKAAAEESPSPTESGSAAAKKTSTKATAKKTAAVKAKAPKSQLGQGRRDGKFNFTVTSVKCGRTRIGSAAFGVEAQGKFCLVAMKVKNIDKEPQTLFGDNQKLFVGEAEYSANTEAAIYLDDSKSIFEEINPGNTLTGIVVFDVPKNAKPTKLELHDSLFSGGVDVRL